MKMKTILLILFSICLSPGFAQVLPERTDAHSFAKEIFFGMCNLDFAKLIAMGPDAALLRNLVPGIDPDMSDKDVMEKYARMDKLKGDVESLKESFKTAGISCEDLLLTDINIQLASPGSNMPEFVSLKYDYIKADPDLNMEGDLAVTMIRWEGKWYLGEILRSVGVFDHLKQ